MSVFRFKYFYVKQEKNPLKVGTDSMLLGALIEASGHEFALDLGAGTGVLSLMIAQKNPEIKIDAIEIREDGSQECRENFESSLWAERLTVYQGDYFEFQFEKTYDLIFSNPPYYLDGLSTKNPNINQAKHSNQIEVIKFLHKVNSALSTSGEFWIIIPYSNFDFFKKIAKSKKLYPKQEIIIHAKHNKRNKRVVVCFQRKNFSNVVSRELVIRNYDNQYSSEYVSLTREFHWELF